MDFDIGNIFYIVITLVVVIIGLLGKKKSPAKDTGEGKGSSLPGFMENLEKAFNPDQEEQYAANLQDSEPELQQEESDPEYKDVPEPMTLMEEYESLQKSRGDQVGSSGEMAEGITTEPLEIIYLDEEEGTDYFEVIKGFEAGTAVVYSTIINRLDY